MFSRSSGFGAVSQTVQGVAVATRSSLAQACNGDAAKAAASVIVRFFRMLFWRRRAATFLWNSLETFRLDEPANVLRAAHALRFALFRCVTRIDDANAPPFKFIVAFLKSVLPLDRALSGWIGLRGCATTSRDSGANLYSATLLGSHGYEKLLATVVQIAVSIVHLSDSGAPGAWAKAALLSALQLLLALSGDSSSVRPHLQELASTNPLAKRCIACHAEVSLLRIWHCHAASWRRRSAARIAPGDTTPKRTCFAVFLDRLREGEVQRSSASQQELLVLDALQKITWNVLGSCKRVADTVVGEMHTNDGAVPEVTDLITTTVNVFRSSVLSLRLPVAAKWVDGSSDQEGLRQKVVLLQWMATVPTASARSGGAVSSQGSKGGAAVVPSATVVANHMALQLALLGRLLSLRPDVLDSEIALWTSWWWPSLVGSDIAVTEACRPGVDASSSSFTVSPQSDALLRDEEAARLKAVARDPFLLEQLSPLWRNSALLSRLCLPPPPPTTAHLQTPASQRESSEGGLFAELRRLASSSSSKTSTVGTLWEGSLVRKLFLRGCDEEDAEKFEKTASAFMLSFEPPLWCRGCTLLSIFCTESVQPLHQLAFHGPALLHRLFHGCLQSECIATAVDLLYINADFVHKCKQFGSQKQHFRYFSGDGKRPCNPLDVVRGPVRAMALVAHSSLALLAQWCSHLLLVTGDSEFEASSCPVPFHHVHRLVDTANTVLLALTQRMLDTSGAANLSTLRAGQVHSAHLLRNSVTDRWIREDTLRIRVSLSHMIRAFIDRSLRMPHLTHSRSGDRRGQADTGGDHSREDYNETFWFLPNETQELIFPGSFEASTSPKTKDIPWSPLQVAMVRSMPHTVPMPMRIDYFNRLLAEDRSRFCGPSANMKLGITVKRGQVFFDAMDQLQLARTTNAALSQDGRLMRVKWHVRFLDRDGREEAGIDAGGVFKEFVEQLMKEALNPDVGLFVPVDNGGGGGAEGAAQRVLMPNPHAKEFFGAAGGAHVSHLDCFYFVGLMVAKAIYEGIVLQVEFSPPFLSNVLGRGCSIDDLKLIDPQQFQSLSMLKTMDNVDAAELFFCVDEDVFGTLRTIDLIEGGRSIRVTNDNVVLYMHTVANYKLVKVNREETERFAAGFMELLPGTALRFLFNRRELQQLISGRSGLRLDVNDLKQHCRLVGGIKEGCRTLTLLWEVLEELSTDDQGRFLQFCTGSSKPPLLGFAAMNPPFSIRGVEDSSFVNFLVDLDRLPSASTCFNLLKLPLYKNKSNLREKLLQAIRADSGFQLS